MDVDRSFVRRDTLLRVESEVQAAWAQSRLFEATPGDAKTRANTDKYFATFPYPYMNGVLHLGHAFTLAKVDFQCAFQRLKGKNVLFPFGYHCTGMPIAACAQKLSRELALYGNPPVFPAPPEPVEEAKDESADKEEKDDKKASDGAKKGKAAKSKLTKKASKEVYQWNILLEMGVPASDVSKFADPHHWLRYFPPIATRDLRAFGLAADFRRSFITTDVNPYYDAFIRWHFNTLKRKDKIDFGGRLSIFSPIDNQSCADHDRAEGEGVDLTEYALIKLKLMQPYPNTITQLLEKHNASHLNVFLPAATLRPETMYGQTNAWVLPDGVYGVYQVTDHEVFVCSEKSALNMSYQHLSLVRGKPTLLGNINGSELLGKAIEAPLAKYEKLYLLPLTTIKMDKATGIVTSVPSDAPDDYAALMDLKNKKPFREKFGIEDHMVLPYDIVQIIETPGLGKQPAADLCVAEKVASQNDRVKLDLIKERVYREGFAKGIMQVGPHAGQKVSDAKPLIKAELIAAGLAYPYAEPEKRVVSRSGNECVVALSDQWYLKYGEDAWRAQVQHHVESVLETYNPQTRKDFLGVVSWLHEWACSRSFGLGTRLPWDPQYVIESLSDSTIYMAYYTIAHYLQGNGAENLDGLANPSPAIRPQQLTDDVWNYIFLSNEFPNPPQTDIPIELLNQMRNEFEYWYPMDLRVSGKDLIGNHLTMCLYNHAAIWNGDANKMPVSFFTNGHVMIDHEKMSKSTGNFITLRDAIKEYSADATRFALADAGDGLEDANFDRKNANAAILKLTKEEEWAKKLLADQASLRTGEWNFFDQVFNNEMNRCIADADAAYSQLQYREALKAAWHNLQTERDNYRLSVASMHRELITRYFQISCILLSPICPHFAQHMWQLTGSDQSGVRFVRTAAWPTAAPVDTILARKINYLRDTNANLRKSLLDQIVKLCKPSKNKAEPVDAELAAVMKQASAAAVSGTLLPELTPQLFNMVNIWLAIDYPQWQSNVLKLIAQIYESKQQNGDKSLPDRKEVIPKLKEIQTDGDKKALENATKFANSVLEDLAVRGAAALELQTPFSEVELLNTHLSFVMRDVNIANIHIYNNGSELHLASKTDPVDLIAANKAKPGAPAAYFAKI